LLHASAISRLICITTASMLRLTASISQHYPGAPASDKKLCALDQTTRTPSKQHIREPSRYQTDVTDEEWLVIMPHLPSANSTGRPRAWPMREIINGISSM